MEKVARRKWRDEPERDRRERLLSFLDPFADAGDTGFQAVQALTAIGSGGFFGVGLGESVQKIFYLHVPIALTAYAGFGWGAGRGGPRGATPGDGQL